MKKKRKIYAFYSKGHKYSIYRILKIIKYLTENLIQYGQKMVAVLKAPIVSKSMIIVFELLNKRDLIPHFKQYTCLAVGNSSIEI